MAKKKDYKSELTDLLNILGNDIVSITHCQTRLRIVLNNFDNVDIDALNRLESSKGAFVKSGQLQIVIGPEVPDYYKAFMKELENSNISFSETSVRQIKQDDAKKQNGIKRVISFFGEIFVPIIPIIVAGGLILAFRNLLELNWTGDPNNVVSAVNNSEFFAQLNSWLWLPADAVFFYLPVVVTWSVFKKMKAPEAVGIVVGIMLVAPDVLVNMYTVSGMVGEVSPDGDVYNNIFEVIQDQGYYFFNGFPWSISYVGQVIPAIMMGFIGAWIWRFFDNHTTNSVRYVWPPFVTILLTQFIALAVIGPIGAFLGSLISFIFDWGFTTPGVKYVAAPLFGFFYPFIVVTGLHHTLNAVMIQQTTQIGYNYLFPILATSNMAQAGAVLGVVWMARKDKKMTEVGASSSVTCMLGVTEPAMYSVNLQYVFPFIAAASASAIMAEVLVLFNVSAVGIGMGGILGFLNAYTGDGSLGIWALVIFLLVLLLAVALAFWLTIFLSKFKIWEKYAPLSWATYKNELADMPNVERNFNFFKLFKSKDSEDNEIESKDKNKKKLDNTNSILTIVGLYFAYAILLIQSVLIIPMTWTVPSIKLIRSALYGEADLEDWSELIGASYIFGGFIPGVMIQIGRMIDKDKNKTVTKNEEIDK